VTVLPDGGERFPGLLQMAAQQLVKVVDDLMLSEWPRRLMPYVALLRALVEGRLTGEDVEVIYLLLYLRDSTMWEPDEFGALDSFFADVDAFCADPTLRDEHDLDEEALRESAARTLTRLAAAAAVRPESAAQD
jgi:hypothetical protein